MEERARESEGSDLRDAQRPVYEPPRIQVMTEREILNSFQITQAMSTWWLSC